MLGSAQAQLGCRAGTAGLRSPQPALCASRPWPRPPRPAGYLGLYTNKAGKAGFSVREGSATFFRTSRFSLAAHRGVTLKHLFPAKVGRAGTEVHGCRAAAPRLLHCTPRCLHARFSGWPMIQKTAEHSVMARLIT